MNPSFRNFLLVALLAWGFPSFTQAVPADTLVVAWGDNEYGQRNVPAGLTDVTAIAGGDNHTVVLKSDGTVVAWGANDFGQSTPPVGLSDVVAISAGISFSVALKGDGTVVAWGSDEDGEATVPGGLSNVVAIAAGGFHSVALKEDGTVVAWGDNTSGEAVVPGGLSDVTGIAAGFAHTVALKEDGTVVVWGWNFFGQGSVPVGLSDVKAISAGALHTVALKQDGTVVAWGDNSSGQRTVPASVSGALAIAAGGFHTVALIRATRVTVLSGDLTFGSVQAGQTAIKTLTIQNTGNAAMSVTAIDYPEGFSGNWSSGTIAVGGRQDVTVTFAPTAAQSYSGTITVTANATSGINTTTASGTGTPTLVVSPVRRSVGAAGGTFEFIVTASEGWSWSQSAGSSWVTVSETASQSGNQTFSYTVAANTSLAPRSAMIHLTSGVSSATHYFTQVGSAGGMGGTQGGTGTVVAWGSNDYGQTTVPAGLSGVTAITTGGEHTVALKSDGTVVAWGKNDSNQCAVPAGLSGVIAIAAGGIHTVALKSDGTVVAWGYDGLGATNVPAGLRGVTAIAAGWWYTVALKGDGTVVAWGDNYHGQATVPVGLSGVTAIAAGANHTVALKGDGTLVAWGESGFGATTVPAGLGSIADIAAGGSRTVVLKSDGTVVSWGEVGMIASAPVPAGLKGVAAIAAGGGGHKAAVKADGTVVAWGNNDFGQRKVPAGLSRVAAIAAGGFHSAALVLSPVSLTVVRDVPGAVVGVPDKAGTLAFKVTPANAASKVVNGNVTILPTALVSVTATAKAGYLFSHWSGLPGGAQEAGNVLTFTMPTPAPNLTAVFIENPFLSAPFKALGAKPVFQGLLRPENPTPSSNATAGLLDAALTPAQGSLSGKVSMDGKVTSYTGLMRGDGSVWFKVGNVLKADLPLLNGEAAGKSLTASWSVTGLQASVNGPDGTSSGLAQPPLYSKTHLLAADSGLLDSTGKQGYFTLALLAPVPGSPEEAATYPQGAGYSSLSLTNGGTLKLAGVLADGTKITASSFVVAGDESAVLVQLPTPGGKTKNSSVLGVLKFDSTQPNSDVTSAELQWFRAAAETKLTVAQSYRAGWPEGIALDAVGALYEGTQTVQDTLGLGAVIPGGNAALGLTAGKLTGSLEISVNLNGSKVEKLNAQDKSFTLSFTPKTGLFKGTFTPNWTSPGKTLPAFQGILIQKGSSKSGNGYFLSNRLADLNPESGAVQVY